MNRDHIRRILGRIPIHVVVIGMCIIWLVPTFGLLITSLRPFQAVNSSGWWTVLSKPTGAAEYEQYCAACHGPDGKLLPDADLTDPEVVNQFPRSLQLLAMLRKDIDGSPHLG